MVGIIINYEGDGCGRSSIGPVRAGVHFIDQLNQQVHRLATTTKNSLAGGGKCSKRVLNAT